jgi:hypothetical protein
MAEHVKLMGTAAKAGVTMALLALVAGVAGDATGQATGMTPAAQVLNGRSALKLKVKGLSPELKHDLMTIQTDFNFVSKLMEEEGIFYYFNHGGHGHRLLTVGAANATFLKISDANTKFLPIADANAKFLQGVSAAATLSRSTRQGRRHQRRWLPVGDDQ